MGCRRFVFTYFIYTLNLSSIKIKVIKLALHIRSDSIEREKFIYIHEQWKSLSFNPSTKSLSIYITWARTNANTTFIVIKVFILLWSQLLLLLKLLMFFYFLLFVNLQIKKKIKKEELEKLEKWGKMQNNNDIKWNELMPNKN